MKKQAILKKLHKPVSPALSIAAVAGTIAICIIIMVMRTRTLQQPLYQNQTSIPVLSSAPTQAPNSTDGRYIPLTPTILSASRQGWMTFVYPDPNKKYTFEYPSLWKLEIIKDKYSPTYLAVSLNHKDNTTPYEYGIEFMTGGRGGPDYDYSKIIKHIYGGRSATEKILYKDSKPFEASVSFDDYKPDSDPFVGIDIKYPTVGIEQYQQTVDEILSSLKFYY